MTCSPAMFVRDSLVQNVFSGHCRGSAQMFRTNFSEHLSLGYSRDNKPSSGK
uniref:Uncharacterized protein n=1 Tax=Arion vulgaris TaxID=1028688 RepID=A0A0B6YR27_9EUPU